MFGTFEELTRFGKCARQILVKSIARWTAAVAIAALCITSAMESVFVDAAEIETFLYRFLVAE